MTRNGSVNVLAMLVVGVLTGAFSGALLAAPSGSSTSGDDSRDARGAGDLSPWLDPTAGGNDEDETPSAAEAILRELDRQNVEQGGEPDPMMKLAERMGDVGDRLGLPDVSTDAQKTQAEIVSELDRLIALLEQMQQQQQQQPGGGGGGQPAGGPPNGGLSDSQLMDRSAPEGPLRDAAEGERDWHDVNPRVRDRILQSRQEGFPAGYDDVLKDYYRAMAEQDVSAEPFASLEAPEEE